MVFGRNFSKKNEKFGYPNPIVGKLDFGRWLIGKPMVNFLFALIELFAIYYGSGVMKRNVYRSVVSTGVDLFALKFCLDTVVPINLYWHQKTRDTGLPYGEDRIPLRSLVLTQCRSVTDGEADRRTDGQTDLE